MLDVLRTNRTRLTLAIIDYADQTNGDANDLPSWGGKTTGRPNQFVYLRTTLLNQSREFCISIISSFNVYLSADPQILKMNLTLSPSEHVLYEGVQSDIPVGKLNSGEERQVELGICFVSEGRFDLRAEAWLVGYDVDENAKAGEGGLRVLVRDDHK